jgi:hypothetical protein
VLLDGAELGHVVREVQAVRAAALVQMIHRSLCHHAVTSRGLESSASVHRRRSALPTSGLWEISGLTIIEMTVLTHTG